MRKQYNYYNSINPDHKYFLGGLVKGIGNQFKGGMDGNLGNTLSSIGGVVGDAASGLISGGYDAGGAGKAFSTLGNIASAIPGPWGAVAGAGLKVVGGLVNRAFGTKTNEKLLKEASQQTDMLNSFNSDANSFDSLNTITGTSNVGQVHQGGWFSKGKANRKNAELRRQRDQAFAFAENSLENNIDNLQNDQLNNALANMAAYGGLLSTQGADFFTGLNFINEGGTHESNPLEGVPMGTAPDGKPNLVEEGEVIYNKYVFSNRLKIDSKLKNKYKIKGGNPSYADTVKQLSKIIDERPNDPISKGTLDEMLAEVMSSQEATREAQNKGNKFAKGGRMGYLFEGEGDMPNFLNKYAYKFNLDKPLSLSLNAPDYKSFLTSYKVAQTSKDSEPKETTEKPADKFQENFRYIAPIAQGAMALTDALGFTNKADTRQADELDALARSVDYKSVGYTPNGSYVKYNPVDTNYISNRIASSLAASRRAIANQSGGNRGNAMAGILASDYDNIGKLGATYMDADNTNYERLFKSTAFNNDVDLKNAQGAFSADSANAQSFANAQNLAINTSVAAADARAKARQLAEAARSANINSLLDSFSGIGTEAKNRNVILGLSKAGVLGNMTDEIKSYLGLR